LQANGKDNTDAGDGEYEEEEEEEEKEKEEGFVTMFFFCRRQGYQNAAM
jgi:hypothetical protein